MIVGNMARFAIEAEAEIFDHEWVLGRFRFWLNGHEVGDWDDLVDLKGCMHWLGNFARDLPDRFDPLLVDLRIEDIFKLIYEPVMGFDGISDPRMQPVPHAYARFHISHLGMSSFDRFDVLLLKDAHGSERCIWREAESNIMRECRLANNEMENVASEFCMQFDKELRIGKAAPAPQ